jgi:hypothetical protein
MLPPHKAVGSCMESRRARQMNAAHAGQGVEELRFELSALVGGDGVRASVTHPSGQQGSGYCLRRNVRQGNGVRPACKASYFRKAVSEAV